MLNQSTIWLQITTIFTIVISLASLFGDHSAWFKEFVKCLDNSPKNYSFMVITAISIFIFSLITDFSVYLGTRLSLNALKHQAYKNEK